MSEGGHYKIIHKNKFRLLLAWAGVIVSVAFVIVQTPFAFIALAVQLVKYLIT